MLKRYGKNMIGEDPFYLYPLDGEGLKYFVGRDREIDYVMKINRLYNGMVVPVIGGIGSGKTSFLNAVKHLYVKRTGRSESVEYIRARDFMNEYKPSGDVEVLLIDNVGDLPDADAITFYNRVYDFASKTLVNIIFTDKPDRSREAQKLREWVSTGRKLWMDWTDKEIVKNMKKRLEIGGIGDVFTDESLRTIAVRTGSNLREFLKYAREIYLEYGETKKITKEDAAKVIIEIDREDIERMDEVSKAVIKVLSEKVQVGHSGGLNAKMLKMYVDEELNRTISTPTLYESLKRLAEDRFILSRRSGRETLYSTIYDEMGISLSKEKCQHQEKDSGLMFSSGGQVE